MTVAIKDQPDQRAMQDIEKTILLAVKGIRFGSVEIIIHDSKIVQIERKEKMRIDTDQSRTSQVR